MRCSFLFNIIVLTALPLLLQAQSAVAFPAENLPQPQQYQPHTALEALLPQQAARPRHTLALEKQVLPPVLDLMKNGQWQRAKQALTPLLVHTPPSLHGLFLAGQIAEQQQEWQSAVGYYRKMLAIDSNLHRPRLELAKVLAKSGEIKASEYQFNLALSQQLPQNVESNVYAILQHLNAQTAYLNLQFALLPNSNVNQATTQRSVIFQGKEVVLSENSRAKRGIGLQFSVDGEKRFGKEYKWFVNGSLFNLDYANRRNDQTATRLMIGRSFGNQRRHSLDIAVGGHHLLYRHKGLYQGVVGRADYNRRLRPNWKLSLSWETQQLHYRPEYAYQRGWQHWLNTRLTHISQGKTIYYWGIQQGFNQAAEKRYSNRSLVFQTGIRHQFDWLQLTIGGQLAYGKTDYRDVSPFFGIIRHDKRWSGSVDFLKRDWSWKGFAPRLSFHYTDNRSTIPLNTYQNKQVRLMFSKEF
ncbi:hypothetical protein A1D23_04900 [Chelonobacter oris]|uniref:surface lipoprotein assembly modifier n=1 Tax=Chelonobacter oris TaxID=505317 RepID=UPI002448E212|nr:surface lipoprotein assembly modifier [Chelonobacter oris]MDH2999438.1 hypothetical protein [Chelonobacter oris]